jgi:predicted RNase H-like HicB family nuclease
MPCPSFKGCHSYGDSIEEAISNISEAIEACLKEEVAEEPAPLEVGPRNFSLLQIVKPQNSPKIDLRSPILTSKKALKLSGMKPPSIHPSQA